MVLYEYNCDNCGLFEIRQSIKEEPLTTCPQCGGFVYRVIHPAEVIWRGRFKWMKFNPEVDMDKIEAEERR